jgi:hypothetical protein
MNEETDDVYSFVAEYITRESHFSEVESFEAMGDENSMWLETTDSTSSEGDKDHYWCNKCTNHIGEEEKDVFEHIRDEHPSVTGLIIEKPTEENVEYDDD